MHCAHHHCMGLIFFLLSLANKTHLLDCSHLHYRLLSFNSWVWTCTKDSIPCVGTFFVALPLHPPQPNPNPPTPPNGSKALTWDHNSSLFLHNHSSYLALNQNNHDKYVQFCHICSKIPKAFHTKLEK